MRRRARRSRRPGRRDELPIALRVVREHEQPVGFLAFDDFDYAETLGISVVSHDPAQMGREAARLALAALSDLGRAPTRIVLPTRLIRRGSAEAPPSPGRM